MIRRQLRAAALLPAAFSGGSAAAHRSAFPDLKSSECPFASPPGHTPRKLQGVAHGSSRWYMTNKAKLRKIPVHRDLGAPAPWSVSAGIPWERRVRAPNRSA